MALTTDALLQIIAAENGTYTVNVTDLTTIDAVMMRCDEDTVFSRIEVNGVATDVKTDYIRNAATGFKSGALISAKRKSGHKYFSKIQLTSGSVTIVNR